MQPHDVSLRAASKFCDRPKIGAEFTAIVHGDVNCSRASAADSRRIIGESAELTHNCRALDQRRIEVNRHGVIGGDHVAHAANPSLRQDAGERHALVVHHRIDHVGELHRNTRIAKYAQPRASRGETPAAAHAPSA
jgi:hypothetical protein